MQLGQLRLDLIINILDGETKIKSFTKTVNGLDTAFNKTKKESVTLSGALQNVGLRVQGLTGIFSILKSTVGDMVSKFNEFKSAQLGLQSVATFKNLDPAVVSNTIRSLDSVAAGLIGVGDASTSLKNLLSANFTLEQSVELLKRLGDAAAFGRQGSLSFGEAVRSATEGIKNGNSILVDNAGVTKNLSVMLQEAGLSASDLMKASTDSSVRMAIFNGVLRETQGQLGDTSKLMNSSQGASLLFEKSVNDLKIAFGEIISVSFVLLKPISELLGYIANAPANVKTAALAITLLTTAFIAFNSSIPNSVKLISTLFAVAIALPAPLRALIGVFGLLTVAIVAFSSGLTIASGGLNLIIPVLAASIALLSSAVTDLSNIFPFLSKSVASTRTELTDLASSINQTNSELSKTADELSKMTLLQSLHANKTKLTDDQLGAYNSTLQSLGNTYPGIIDSTDSHSGALTLNTEKLDILIQKTTELTRIELSKKLDENTQSIIDSSDAFFEAAADLEELRKETEIYSDWVGDLTKRQKEIYDSTNGLTSATEEQIESYKNYADAIALRTVEEANAESQTIALESATMSNLDAVSELIGQYLNLGDIIPLLANLRMETGNNSSAVNYLQIALGNMGAAGFAAINGINTNLVQHTSVFKSFADAWSQFTAAVQSGNLAAVQSAYNAMMSAMNTLKSEAVKLNTKTAPGFKPSGGKTKSSSDYKKEKDAVDELIESLKKEYDIYKADDDIKKLLNKTGLDELSIIRKINDALNTNSFTVEQTLKLYELRKDMVDELNDIQKRQNELLKKEAEALQDIYDRLTEGFADLASERRRIKSEGIALDMQEADLLENRYISAADRIRLEFQKSMFDAEEETDPATRKRKEDIALRKRDKELRDLKAKLKSDIIDTITNGLSSGLSIIQQMGSLLGLAADSFISKLLNGLQQAISLASSILNFISTVSSAFSSGGLFSAIGLFASGGYVPGSGSGDSVPALLTPGEFVINKSRVSSLLSTYGSGFLSWLNGGSILSQNTGHFASGGLVPASPSSQTIHIIAEDKISGENIYKIWHVVDSKRSRWSSS